jgi:integrase
MADRPSPLAGLNVAPILLTREQAAAYVAVSVETFEAEVKRGMWPRPIQRGEKGGKRTWVRSQLDAALGQDGAIARARAVEPAPPVIPPGTIHGAAIAYKASPEFRALKPRTQELYRHYLDWLQTRVGRHTLTSIKPGMVRVLRDELQARPSKANMTLTMLSILLERARLDGRIQSNPAHGISRVPTKPRTQLWTVEDEDRCLEAFRPTLRLAFMLLLYTIQRPSDVLAMRLDQIREAKGGRLFIGLRQAKTEQLVDVPVHARLAPLLRARMAEKGKGSLLIPSPTGKPWNRRNFSRAWDLDLAAANAKLAEQLAAAGKSPEHVAAELQARHRQRRDLRRTGMVRLAEAGATTTQIAAISGHEIDYCQRILNTYIPRRTEVALGGIEAWERAGGRRRAARVLPQRISG